LRSYSPVVNGRAVFSNEKRTLNRASAAQIGKTPYKATNMQNRQSPGLVSAGDEADSHLETDPRTQTAEGSPLEGILVHVTLFEDAFARTLRAETFTTRLSTYWRRKPRWSGGQTTSHERRPAKVVAMGRRKP
jgi:hypothetical protein